MEIYKIKLLAHISEVRKNLDEMEKILNDKRSVDEGEKSFKHHELDIPFVQSQGGIPQDNENEGD